MPVLSTPVGDVPSFLVHGGRLTGFGREDLVAGLLGMMRLSAEERRSMGLQGRRLVEGAYSLEASITQTAALLARFAAPRP